MGHSPIAWLTVIPGFTPARRASGATCHKRRLVSGASSASGCREASSGRRATSQRSANSGIQQQAAESLVSLGGRVIDKLHQGTRIYPEDRATGKNPDRSL